MKATISPKVVSIEIDQLKPAPYNPRKISKEARDALDASPAPAGVDNYGMELRTNDPRYSLSRRVGSGNRA